MNLLITFSNSNMSVTFFLSEWKKFWWLSYSKTHIYGHQFLVARPDGGGKFLASLRLSLNFFGKDISVCCTDWSHFLLKWGTKVETVHENKKIRINYSVISVGWIFTIHNNFKNSCTIDQVLAPTLKGPLGVWRAVSHPR